MSDCSTQAMRPKEPPKTCGTCDKFVLAKGCDHLGICSEIYFEDEYGNDAFAAVRDTRACDNPSLYKPRMADCDSCPERIPEDACGVKARCYDLQEAVRDMLLHIGLITVLLNEHDLLSEAKLNAEDFERFDARLKDLGVSLDG